MILSFWAFRPLSGLAWMVVAQLFFAGMNVCTRLGARDLPWSEIAACRFFLGAALALGIAWYRGSSLRESATTPG
jgi:ABC-type Na+ efflux pump permease subunit